MIFSFKNPERLIGIPKPDLESVNGNIVIYGTEICGALASHALKQKGINFLAYADSDPQKHGKIYYGHRILSPKELQENHPDSTILIASSAYKSIRNSLISYGFLSNQIFPCFPIFEGMDLSGFKSQWHELQIFRSVNFQASHVLPQINSRSTGHIHKVSLYLTNKCTLKCKECFRRVPELENPSDYDADLMLQSVHNIVSAGFTIDVLGLSGGESFLYQSLPKLLNEFSNCTEIGNIWVVTNATLMPSAELLKALKNDKIIVNISNYGEISSKLEDLKVLFIEHNIRYEDTRHKFWWKILDVEKQKTPEQLQSRFDNCHYHVNKLKVFEGKGYLCATATVADQRGWVKIPENETVNLLDNPDNIKQKLNMMLSRKKFHTGCPHCLFASSNDTLERVPVAEQLP